MHIKTLATTVSLAFALGGCGGTPGATTSTSDPVTTTSTSAAQRERQADRAWVVAATPIITAGVAGYLSDNEVFTSAATDGRADDAMESAQAASGHLRGMANGIAALSETRFSTLGRDAFSIFDSCAVAYGNASVAIAHSDADGVTTATTFIGRCGADLAGLTPRIEAAK